MSGLIAWLEDINEGDTKARAVLRRSLAFDPGLHIPAYPYIEPFLKGAAEGWRRQMHYLAAGLWGQHKREDHSDTKIALAVAVGRYDLAHRNKNKLSTKDKHKPTSTERRFITLLDADEGQLAHRLRQMVALLKEHPIDFQGLLDDLLQWRTDDTHVQITWARNFYRTLSPADTSETEPEVENDE